jgi:hypothetical protein
MAYRSSGYRSISFWHDSVDDDLTARGALPGDLSVDVAIVGAGLTGLWTAYYLLQREPTLRIVVLEKHIAGYGASGRNGGWCSSLFPASTAALEREHGRAAALAMRRAMIDTVDEVGRVTGAEGIDCDLARGGTLSLARSPVQLEAARAEVAEARRYGVDDVRLQSTSIGGAVAATLDPACARLHPAELVRGLARLLESRGVTIHEQTEVLDWAPHTVTTRRSPTIATCSSTASAPPTIVSRSAAAAPATTGAAASARATTVTRGCSTTSVQRSSSSSRRPRTPPSRTAGVDRWACTATGTHRLHTTAPPASQERGVTSATDSARRTSQDAPWPTSSPRHRPRSPGCPG